MKEYIQENLDKTIGKNVSTLRKKDKNTQTGLARFLNIDRSTMSKIESGARSMTISQLLNLCEKFNISIFYLLGITNCRQSNAEYINEAKSKEKDEYEIMLNTTLPFINALKEVSSKYSPELQDKFALYVYQALKPNKK